MVVPVLSLAGDVVAEIEVGRDEGAAAARDDISKSSGGRGLSSEATPMTPILARRIGEVRLQLAERLGVSASSLRIVRGLVALSDHEPISGEEQQEEQTLTVVRLPPLRFATASSEENAVRIWCSETGERLATLSGHHYFVFAIAFSPEGTYVITGCWDGTAKLWCAESGTCILTFDGHGLTVRSVALSWDPGEKSRRALTGSNDSTAKVWCPETGKCLTILQGHEGAVVSVALSSDGGRALTGSNDGTARVWCTKSGGCLYNSEEHIHQCDGAIVASVAYLACGSFVFVSLAGEKSNGAMKVYRRGVEMDAPTVLLWSEPRRSCITRASFDAGAEHLCTWSWHGPAKVWHRETGALLVHLCGDGDDVHIVGPVASDGDRFLVGAIKGPAGLCSIVSAGGCNRAPLSLLCGGRYRSLTFETR